MSLSCTTKRLITVLGLLLQISLISAQVVLPSNGTSDIPPYESSPRFWVNGTDTTSFRIYPLGLYSSMSQQVFLSLSTTGRLVRVDSTNANQVSVSAIDYISCDPQDYPGVLSVNDILRLTASTQQGNAVILYSTRAQHCNANSLPAILANSGVFTTLDPVLAGTVLGQIQNATNGMPVSITPDSRSFTNTSNSNNGQPGYTSSSAQPGPTTAVAMIILYTITGIITLLFVVIIVTGAVRAHRHPERYGPSDVAGRPRRSRAKGIARAMLETIPIVKFGETKDEPIKKDVDLEMHPKGIQATADQGKPSTAGVTDADTFSAGAISSSTTTNADGTDDSGKLGCSICTEDFNKGEEVRVLPCNHKFHPVCVDPWLLNVSGTCPLCRIDLRPKEQQLSEGGEAATSAQRPIIHERRESILDFMAPPLGHLPIRLDRQNERRPSNTARRDNTSLAGLRSVVHGSREDRIAALRRFRQQRNGNGQAESSNAEEEEERRGLSTRLRERFRIRTRRLGEEETTGEASTEAQTSTQ